MKTVISIGEVVWDMLPDGARLGGAPVNFAYYVNALGHKALPVTACGNDELGDRTMAALADTGLDLSLVQRNVLSTSRVLVETDAEGVPQYDIVENVAWDALECRPEDIEAIWSADAVCWGTLAHRSVKSREAILKMLDSAPASALKVFDINIRQHYYSREIIEASLKYANVLKLNEDELPLLCGLLSVEADGRNKAESLVGAEIQLKAQRKKSRDAEVELSGKSADNGVDSDVIDGTVTAGDSLSPKEISAAMEIIRKWNLRYLIYTKGAVGSAVFDASGLASYKATPKVKVADTVGAGDSFTATFVSSLLGGKTVQTAHSLAVKISAHVCTCSGAINPLPGGIEK